VAISSTVKLNKSGTEITINGPVGPTNVQAVPQYISRTSQGLNRYSYKKTSARVQRWTLRFDSLTAAQWAALENFASTVINGPTSTFTYTHTDGNSYTVRMINDGLVGDRIDSNTWSTTLQLEIVSAGVA
jgi:hypothetical protein